MKKPTPQGLTPTEPRAASLPLHGTALAIYYGSNMGSCEEIAQSLAQRAKRLGFVSHVQPLDEAVEALPNSGLILIVTATYNGLQTREPGDIIHAFVKPPTQPFTLPAYSGTPIIMIGPGTGFAPFRGFLQERLALLQEGQSLAPALLFFGCRRPDQDFIYREDMEALLRKGVMQLHLAFSDSSDGPFRYVQDRLWEQRDCVWQLLQQGAIVYVCGDGLNMAPEVRATFVRIHSAQTQGTPAAGEAFVQKLEGEQRYLVDVFGQKKT